MSELPIARIKPNAVYVGGEKLPGLIMERGVTVEAGGATHANIMTVKFIVGEVIVDDTTDYRVEQ